MANRNKTAGSNWEREVRRTFIDLGWDSAQTSRYASKMLDDLGVDLINTEPFYIQCKSTSKNLNIHNIIAEMPQVDGIMNIVAERRTEKRGKRFFKVGEYVHMKWDDFISLLKEIYE